MNMSTYFTSESVAHGHPDKIADQIADAILDACLMQDPDSHVACEVLISHNLLVLAGEIKTVAHVDYIHVAKEMLRDIGYGAVGSGFDFAQCKFINHIHEQSSNLSSGLEITQGAGDQGILFGYASDETPELMPWPIMLSHRLMQELKSKESQFPFLKPDGKGAVTVEYDEKGKPLHIKSIILSAQHSPDIPYKEFVSYLKSWIHEILPSPLFSETTELFINPLGPFNIGGPQADTGLTGRKIIVDTYGGRSHHGGGAFSGKDGTKVDRSGAYMARCIAKNIVRAKFTHECEVHLTYAIGVADPISLRVNLFKQNRREEIELENHILKNFPLRPFEIIDFLELRKPFYKKTAFGGHFGREEFSWENKKLIF